MTKVFKKNLNESSRKPNKIWVDKGGEFYNRSMKSWLQYNDIGMYSVNNETKSVVAEKFIRTLRKKIYKYMGVDLKLEVGDNARISKYKNIFAKYYSPDWSVEFLWLKKIKILVRGSILLETVTRKRKSFDNSFNSWINNRDVVI